MWTTTKYNLILELKIDWEKYQEQNYKLPPEELGICKNWRFVESSDYTSFEGTWELQRIKPMKINLDEISNKFIPFMIEI